MNHKNRQVFDYSLEHLGKRIKEEREKKELTQLQLSEITGISVPHLSNIERCCRGEIGFSKICSIVQGLNITLNDLTLTKATQGGEKVLAMNEDINLKDYSDRKVLLINLIDNLNDVDTEFILRVLLLYKETKKKDKNTKTYNEKNTHLNWFKNGWESSID